MSGLGVLVNFFIFKVGGFSIGKDIILFDEVENSLQVLEGFPGIIVLSPAFPLDEIVRVAFDKFAITNGLNLVALATKLDKIRLRVATHLIEAWK